MKLTKEALEHYWKNREQIFNAQENQAIIKRFFWLSDLFDRFNKRYRIQHTKGNTIQPQIEINTKPPTTYNIRIKLNDKKGTAQTPSSDYFACVKDNVLTNGGLTGVQQMTERFSADKFPDNLPEIITKIGCMLSGSEFNTDSNYFDNNTFIQGNFPYETPIIHEEFRIISNTVTNANDAGTLTSIGQMRHPTLHLANNNYFYNVINLINNINDQTPPQSLVLRWPDSKYYNNKEFQSNNKLNYSIVKDDQLKALNHRFPYKFFYMWANKDNNISIQDNGEINVVKKSEESTTGSRILHLIGLAAYRGLVSSDIDFQSKKGFCNDQDFNQPFQDFKKEWVEFSNDVINIIQNTNDIGLKGHNYPKGYDHIYELSLLLSIVLSKPQEMVDTTELIESGNKALILWGPPGTGKTYTAKQIIRELLKPNDTDNLEDYKFKENLSLNNKTGCWSLVQFHPNYTYEDFIGGISPNLDLANNTLSYTLKEGIFKKICDAAKGNNNKKYILIIDEINRADLSAVFGELMYALEYRNEKITIPNFEEEFTIPDNVYIIGTMNSIDKSLVTFDLALRRRFSFYKVMPQIPVLNTILAAYQISQKSLSTFLSHCLKLNAQISGVNEDGDSNADKNALMLGEDYQIGQAYFAKIKDFLETDLPSDNKQDIRPDHMQKLWSYHLLPLLEEYLGNQVEDADIKKKLKEIEKQFVEMDDKSNN